MKLVVVGINHKTAPVEIREKFSVSAKHLVEVNQKLKSSASLAEALILSTCNRMEIYAASGSSNDSARSIKEFLAAFHNFNLPDFEDKIYVYKDEEAIKHLFKVSSGLDSMVIGEMEILGQVKQAFRDAQSSKTTGKVLNRLFEKSFNTAKKIRTDTFVGRGAVSVSSVAVRLAKKILGELEDKSVLIVGAGLMGEQLGLYLKESNVKSIIVANRTLEKAQALSEKLSASAIAFEDFTNKLPEVDIVITSTGAPHCIIRKEQVLALMPARKQRPLFLIDLAVPRDVQDGVNEIDNVYLYNIDDLEKLVKENIKIRESELIDCDRIIDSAAGLFTAWMVNEKIKK